MYQDYNGLDVYYDDMRNLKSDNNKIVSRSLSHFKLVELFEKKK